MQWLIEIIGEGISLVLGVIVMLIMGIGSLYNKKKKWDEI
jgi:hypothetical protein